jgi:glycosyltransferase involved in cell wall biosynthesis
MAGALLISVIIATRNRAEALRTISLPSLARQDAQNFEVLIWDASEDDVPRRTVEDFALIHPNLKVRYFKAPRAGLCSQRNDAVKEARGEFVFFIDDDSEVSPDGITALSDLFAKQGDITGGALPLRYEWPVKRGGARIGRVVSAILSCYLKVFYTSPRLSGTFSAIPHNKPGPVEDLWGCDMAYRKSIFRDHSFDERLQRYGGYALWEDRLFSHRLHMRGHVLCIAGHGLVVHRGMAGDRVGSTVDSGRIMAYNAGIVWKSGFFPFNEWSVVFFLWARIGYLGLVLLPCLLTPWKRMTWARAAGHLGGLWAFLRDEIRRSVAVLER